MSKFLLITCFLMVILIGTVAASDNLNESQVNHSADDFKKEIDNANDILILNMNYTFNSSVSVNKSIAIDGNNN